jgi:hypothetical protein
MTFRRYQNRWTDSTDLFFSCFQQQDATGDQPPDRTESSSKYQPNVLSYTVTPRAQSKILFEKLTVTQLLKKLPRLLWNPHVHYSHPNSRMAHTLNLRLRRSVLMLFTHQGLGLPGGLFPSSIIKENCICISYPFLDVCYMHSPSHCPFLDHSSNIQSRVPITKLLLMQFSPVVCYFLPFFNTLRQTVMMVMTVIVTPCSTVHMHLHIYQTAGCHISQHSNIPQFVSLLSCHRQML